MGRRDYSDSGVHPDVCEQLRRAADTEAKLQKLCRGIADRMADCGRDNSLLSAMDKAEKQMLVDAGLWREPGA